MVETVDATDDRPAVAERGVFGRIRAAVLSDETLTKKASLNAVASAVDQAARVILKLLVNPFLVVRLGDSLFGTWKVLQGLVGQATPATGRPGEALKWTVAHEQASTDYEQKRRHVGNAVAVWLLFLPLLVPVGIAMAWFAPSWLDIPPASQGTVRLAAAILVLNLVLAGLTFLPQSVLQGENLGYKRLGLSTAVVVVANALVVAAVLSGFGIAGMAVAATAATVLSGAVYIHVARTRVPWFGIARPTRASVRGFAGLSGWFLAWNFIMQSMRAGDIVVLGIAGSPVLVTTYTLARYLPQTVTVAAAMVLVAIMPGLGGMVGRGDLARAGRVRNETTTFIWLMTVIAGAAVLLWEESFLRLWVGAKYYPGTTEMLAIVAMVLQFALIRVDSNVIDLTLNMRRKVLLGALSAVLSVCLGGFFLSALDMGIAGLALGFMSGRLILTICYPVMVGRLLGIPLRRQVKGILRPGAATVLLFLAAASVAPLLDAASWISLGVSGVASTLVIGAVAFFAGLPPRSRVMVRRRIKRVVHR